MYNVIPLCSMKHDLYITYIHISYLETVHRHFSDVDINSDIQNTQSYTCHIN